MIRTWSRGEKYGELKSTAAGYLGISFDWQQYQSSSSVETLKPGQITVVPSFVPHIFHSLGEGFFLGISAKERVKAGSATRTKRTVITDQAGALMNQYPFKPIYDEGYLDYLLNIIDLEQVRTVCNSISIKPSGKAEYGKRRIYFTNEELNIVDSLQSRHKTITIRQIDNVFKKLYRIGAFDEFSLG